MKFKTIILIMVVMATLTAATEFRAGDNITIRTPFSYKGQPTESALCNLDLYSPYGLILNRSNMTDLSGGWYNYTIDGWLTTDNRTSFSGLVLCTFNNTAFSTTFNFDVVRETKNAWLEILNTTTSKSNDYLDSINKSVSQGNADLNSTISGGFATLNQTVGRGNGILDSIFWLLKDIFEFQNQEVQHYQVQVAYDLNFTNIAREKYAPESEMLIEDLRLPNGVYYARIRGYDSVGKRYGRWNNPVVFTLQNSTY